MLNFEVKYIRNCILRSKATVEAFPVALVGIYHEGVPYQPKRSEVAAMIPAQYRKAFLRGDTWWADKDSSLPLVCNLRSTKGKPLGTIVATPLWR